MCREEQSRRLVQITYVVCPGGQGVAERLLRFLAAPFGPIGACSPAQRWSRCWLAGVDGWKEARQQSGSHSVHASTASETPSCLLALLAAHLLTLGSPHSAAPPLTPPCSTCFSSSPKSSSALHNLLLSVLQVCVCPFVFHRKQRLCS